MSHTQDVVAAGSGGSQGASRNETPSSLRTKSWRQQGRVIRRLVTLFDNVQDLIDEALVRRQSLGQTNRQDQDHWLFRTYGVLTARIPRLHEWISNPANLHSVTDMRTVLSEGADGARADDSSLLKDKVVLWVVEEDPLQPRLSPSDKVRRGLHHDITGRLICPVDYNWDDPEQRTKIRDWNPTYLVMANMWPHFLYEKDAYDPDDPAKGLFKGPMLVRAFKAIFTSPSSADEEGPITDSRNSNKRRHGERRTRTHVAGLVAMKSVEPRAIAYTAVQLRFALSSCGSWRRVDDLFDHGAFYENIVKWFEETESLEDKAFIDDLLLWWNREIFGRLSVLNYAPETPNNTSVTTSFKRRRIN